MAKKGQGLSDNKRKLLVAAGALAVLGSFNRFVLKPMERDAKVARPIGQMSGSVAVSTLANQRELPFLAAQGGDTSLGGEINDDVFFVEDTTPAEETPEVKVDVRQVFDYAGIARNYYKLQMKTGGGAIINGTYYSFGEAIETRPFIFERDNIDVRLVRSAGQTSVYLTVGNSSVNLAIL